MARLDPVLDFLQCLWAIEHGLQQTSKRMEATIGVTGPQRLVLRIVSQHPGLSARELADIVYLHPSTITGILRRLVNRGLLIREQDPQDKRRVRLWLKPEAKAFTRSSAGTVERAVRQTLARATEREVRDARAVLAVLAEFLSEA